MASVVIRTSPERKERNLELCPGCVNDIIEQVGTEPAEGTRKRSYQEPWTEQKNVEKKSVDEMTTEEIAGMLGKRIQQDTQRILEM